MGKTENDSVIEELLEIVEDRIADLGSPPPKIVEAGHRFYWHGRDFRHGSNEAILDYMGPQALAEALSIMLDQEHALDRACERLGIKNTFPELKWDGHTISEWTADFKTRIKIHEWHQAESKLNAMEARLESMFSEDVRNAKEIEQIKAFLGVK